MIAANFLAMRWTFDEPHETCPGCDPSAARIQENLPPLWLGMLRQIPSLGLRRGVRSLLLGSEDPWSLSEGRQEDTDRMAGV